MRRTGDDAPIPCRPAPGPDVPSAPHAVTGPGEGWYVRFQGTRPNARGVLPGIFVLVNGLARDGVLTPAQEHHRRTTNDWYDAAYPNPSHLDPAVYDHAVHPGAVAWFKSGAHELIGRVGGYLDTLDAHGIPHRRLCSRDPGRVVHEDAHQVVVVPRSAGYPTAGPSARPAATSGPPGR